MFDIDLMFPPTFIFSLIPTPPITCNEPDAVFADEIFETIFTFPVFTKIFLTIFNPPLTLSDAEDASISIASLVDQNVEL